MGKEKQKNHLTAEEECFKIIQTIWSCKNDEQKKGCENMFETYKKKHGTENLGITFIQLELNRLEHIIHLQELRMKAMQQVQDGLQETKGSQQKLKDLPPEPSQEKLKQAIKDKNVIPIDMKNLSKNAKQKK